MDMAKPAPPCFGETKTLALTVLDWQTTYFYRIMDLAARNLLQDERNKKT